MNLSNWRSPTGVDNALAAQRLYSDGLRAIAEFDRVGHLLLDRAARSPGQASLEQVVGIALLRRAVTVFTAIRELLERSLADPARALARTYLEISLNYRALAYGSTRHVSLDTPTESAHRNARAEHFFLGSERRQLLNRALLLVPDSAYPVKAEGDRIALERELASEVMRLRSEFGSTWHWFGDMAVDPVSVRKVVLSDRNWYAHLWPDRRVTTIRSLAYEFGFEWEYDFYYDAFSALVHARGVRHDVEFGETHIEVRHPHDDTWFKHVAFWVLGWHAILLMTAAKWHSMEMIPQLQKLHIGLREAIKTLEPEGIPPLA